jgi:hypothetical protein
MFRAFMKQHYAAASVVFLAIATILGATISHSIFGQESHWTCMGISALILFPSLYWLLK